MTEIAVRTETGVSLIQQTAANMSDAHKIATAVCGTSMIPAAYRGKPDDATVAILYGETLNLSPMVALQNIFVVHGSPSMYARTMKALVVGQGHTVRTVEESSTSCTVTGRRKEWAESEPDESFTFTLADAELAGYTSNAKYKTDPKAMLYARATSVICRRLAPDVLLGVPYSVEEMEDVQATEVTRVDEPTRSGVSRLAAVVAASTEQPSPPFTQPVNDIQDAEEVPASPVDDGFDDEPPLDEPPYEEPPAPRAPVGEPITKPQVSKIQVQFNSFGCRDRDYRLRVLSRLTGRPITSANELTKAEATAIIDTLEAIPNSENFAAMFEAS